MFAWHVHWYLSEIKAGHWFISWYIFTDIISEYFTDSGLESMMREKSNGNGSLTLWEYYFPHQQWINKKVVVCRIFLCQTLNINSGRFITLQNKIRNNKSLCEKRGGTTHFRKLTDDLKSDIHEHCECLLHTPFHYRREYSSLNYFKVSSLNLSKLYQLFIHFYELKYENKKCPITESTYCKYFNHFVNFTFDMPRTDVCNDCFTYEQTNAKMTDEAVYHYRKVNNYRELKK